ncbi:MAG TPA: response regulator [Stenomitos sp.]
MPDASFPPGDILIVDDRLDNLRLLSEMLTQQGYNVRCVKSGSAALMSIQAQVPDLILLDINMPGMTGYEVCETLQASPQTQTIPVVFISALQEGWDKVRAFAAGGKDYITKPFQLEEVLARVENQLAISRLQRQLMHALAQEQALNRRIEEMAALEERNRIARDIHDSLGHALVALNIQMETALALWATDASHAYRCLAEAKQLGSEALQAVRQSVADIRFDPLQGKSLTQAIATLTQSFTQNTGIVPTLEIDLPPDLDASVNTAIYRVLQEGLTNICKYAAANAVCIRISSDASQVALQLEDNGKGFSVHPLQSGFGLKGMQERIAALGGTLDISSRPGVGCQLRATLPR